MRFFKSRDKQTVTDINTALKQAEARGEAKGFARGLKAANDLLRAQEKQFYASTQMVGEDKDGVITLWSARN